MRCRHVFFQTTHAADVLLAAHPVNHRTASQEQQGFEECVCDNVEDSCAVCAHTKGHKHESQLRYGGVGEYLFDIVLSKGNRCSD